MATHRVFTSAGLALASILVAVPVAHAEGEVTRGQVESTATFPTPRLSLSLGIGSVSLEDGGDGTSLRLSVGIHRGDIVDVTGDLERIDFGLRIDYRGGVSFAYSYLASRHWRLYSTMRGYVARVSESDDQGPPQGTIGLGGALATGGALRVTPQVEAFAEVSFGATLWQDSSMKDATEHDGSVMAGLRTRF